MGKFGWSYPPGCSSPPWDEPVFCLVCMSHEDHCVCPECPVCQSVGDPDCYGPEGHGMEDTAAQLAAVAAYEASQQVTDQCAQEEELLWRAHYEQEEEYYDTMDKYLQSDAYLDGTA